ncbi:MAG: PepSY-associated TM helix domain-containing protein [Steroidobacteraceae bacterium]
MSDTPNKSRRSYWLKTLHQWHWISSAIALIGLLLFSITGVTLNHAAHLDVEPRIVTQKVQLPVDLQSKIWALGMKFEADQTLPALPIPLQDWLNETLSIDISDSTIEWSGHELYLSMPRPGGDAWLSIILEDGSIEYQNTDRGWLAYFNDLHKGRHTGPAWGWFIDIVAGACLLFSITGLFILKMHAKNRPSTWPLVGLGLLVPMLIAILFIH